MVSSTDQTTPRDDSATSTIQERQKKRRQRHEQSEREYGLQETVAHRLARVNTQPSDKALRFAWNRIQMIKAGRGQDVTLSGTELARATPCRVCAAPASFLCICGAQLHLPGRHNAKHVQDFLYFVCVSSPLRSPAEAHGHKEWVDLASSLIGRKTTSSARALCRFLVLAAITGRPETVRSVGPLLARTSGAIADRRRPAYWLEAALQPVSFCEGRGAPQHRGGGVGGMAVQEDRQLFAEAPGRNADSPGRGRCVGNAPAGSRPGTGQRCVPSSDSVDDGPSLDFPPPANGRCPRSTAASPTQLAQPGQTISDNQLPCWLPSFACARRTGGAYSGEAGLGRCRRPLGTCSCA